MMGHALVLAALLLLAAAETPTAPPPAPASAGGIDIPVRTFVALQGPDRGKGLYVAAGMKHVTGAAAPRLGRIYFTGGDYLGAGFDAQSYRQETWSLSIAERWADRRNVNAGWRIEYPYCGPAGEVQPKHPDFVGWQWDDKRRLFWLVPGVFEASNYACPGETGGYRDDPPTATTAGFLGSHLMTFDPATRRWADKGRDIGPHSQDTWQSILDPVKDRLVRIGWDGGSGGVFNIYEIATGQWWRKDLGANALGKDARLKKEYLALDPKTRRVYGIDGINGRLHRFALETLTLEDLGTVPGGPVGSENYTYPVWDSASDVLIWLRTWQNTLHVYHPDTKTWEDVPVATQPVGLALQARTVVYDPATNVTLFFGGLEPGSPYLFLFRYAGPGSPSPSPPSSAPPAKP